MFCQKKKKSYTCMLTMKLFRFTGFFNIIFLWTQKTSDNDGWKLSEKGEKIWTSKWNVYKRNVQVRSGYVKINKLIRCWPIPYKLFAGMRLLSSSNQDIFPPLSRLNIVALGMPVIKIADRLYLLAFINSARNVLWNKSFFPPPRHLTFTRWVRCSVSDGIGIS